MTAAHDDAGIVTCPDCEAPPRSRCVWPDGRQRRTPCLSRMKAAERYDAIDPPLGTEPGSFVRDGLVQLDSDPIQRDITEPIHPQEEP